MLKLKKLRKFLMFLYKKTAKFACCFLYFKNKNYE